MAALHSGRDFLSSPGKIDSLEPRLLPEGHTLYHGLENQGATCYLNSVLQVLFMTRDFREAVRRFARERPATEHIDHQLRDLFDELQKQRARTNEITQKLGIDTVYEQRDAAEYYERILTLTSRDASQIFHGEFTHRVTCSSCRTENDADGHFWSLTLSLMDSSRKQHYSVVDGIEEYFQTSHFSGENQIYCQKCCVKSDATSQCIMKHHPEVLTLLLKRFELDYHYMTYVKNNRTVVVPYTLQIPENQTYELYATVDHNGGLRRGHYTAKIKCQDDERWYTFNDASVTPQLRSSQQFQTDNTEKSWSVYLLFYRKKTINAADTCVQDDQEVVSTNVVLESLAIEDSGVRVRRSPPCNGYDEESSDVDLQKASKHKRTGAEEGDQGVGSRHGLHTSSSAKTQDSVKYDANDREAGANDLTGRKRFERTSYSEDNERPSNRNPNTKSKYDLGYRQGGGGDDIIRDEPQREERRSDEDYEPRQSRRTSDRRRHVSLDRGDTQHIEIRQESSGRHVGSVSEKQGVGSGEELERDKVEAVRRSQRGSEMRKLQTTHDRTEDSGKSMFVPAADGIGCLTNKISDMSLHTGEENETRAQFYSRGEHGMNESKRRRQFGCIPFPWKKNRNIKKYISFSFKKTRSKSK